MHIIIYYYLIILFVQCKWFLKTSKQIWDDFHNLVLVKIVFQAIECQAKIYLLFQASELFWDFISLN